MRDDNPYQPTHLAVPKNRSSSRIRVALWWMIYLHPAIALALVYSCWALTTVSLGRPPRFGEHPENDLAHTAVHVLDIPAMLLILGTPILVPAALGWAFARPFAALPQSKVTNATRASCLISYVLMLAVAAWIVSYDPLRVVYWFMD